MKAIRNILRVDRATISGGYLVRVTRRRKLSTKLFCDKEYGGKRKALLAAKKYRDKLEKTLKSYSAKELARKPRANNTSGIAGVRLALERDTRWESEPEYEYWVAQWSPEKGVRRTRRFSVDKYGYDEAYRLAVKARKKGVASMES